MSALCLKVVPDVWRACSTWLRCWWWSWSLGGSGAGRDWDAQKVCTHTGCPAKHLGTRPVACHWRRKNPLGAFMKGFGDADWSERGSRGLRWTQNKVCGTQWKAWGLLMCHSCGVCGGGPCAMIGTWGLVCPCGRHRVRTKICCTMLLVITHNRVTEYQTTVNKCQRYYSLYYQHLCKILFFLIVKEYFIFGLFGNVLLRWRSFWKSESPLNWKL